MIALLLAATLNAQAMLATERAGLRLTDCATRPETGEVACLVESVPVEEIADPYSRDLFWDGMGLTLDLGSTAAALHFCPTCFEQNPVGFSVEARVALKLGLGTAEATGCWWLRRHGRGRAATIVRWTAFGIQAAAASVNTYHAIRGK